MFVWRLFFATSNPVTAAFPGTLGFPQKNFKLFLTTFMQAEPRFTSFYALHESGNGRVSGNFRVFLNLFEKNRK
jgi:hypothetical protein